MEMHISFQKFKLQCCIFGQIRDRVPRVRILGQLSFGPWQRIKLKLINLNKSFGVAEYSV